MRQNRIKSTKTGLLCILLLGSLLPLSLASRQSHSEGVSSEIEKLEERKGRQRLEKKLDSNVAVPKTRFLAEGETNSARAVGEDGKEEAGEKLAPTGGDDENKEKTADGKQENEKSEGEKENPENGQSEGGQSSSGGNEDDKSSGGGDAKQPGGEGDKENKPEDENTKEKQGEGGKSGGDGAAPGGNEGGNSENKTETDPCKVATTCKDCQDAAKGITEGEKTCWWIEEVCQHVDKEKKSVESMCPVSTPAPSPPQKKPEPTPTDKKPELTPTDKKDSDATPAPTVPSTPSSQGDDDSAGPYYSFYLGILFLVAVAAFLLKYGKRFMQAIPSEARYGSRAQYQGVSTNEEDDDEEWGWGDDSNNNVGDVEMPSKNNGGGNVSAFSPPKTPPFQKTRLHHRARSDEEEQTPALQRSGSGVTPDISSGAQRTGAGSQKPSLPPQHIQKLASPKTSPKKKTQPNLPKDDDIFAEMGLSSMPTFGKSAGPKSSPSATSGSRWQTTGSQSRPVPGTTAVRSLGATALPTADADDLGGSPDWDDDADLDDLLDD